MSVVSHKLRFQLSKTVANLSQLISFGTLGPRQHFLEQTFKFSFISITHSNGTWQVGSARLLLFSNTLRNGMWMSCAREIGMEHLKRAHFQNLIFLNEKREKSGWAGEKSNMIYKFVGSRWNGNVEFGDGKTSNTLSCLPARVRERVCLPLFTTSTKICDYDAIAIYLTSMYSTLIAHASLGRRAIAMQSAHSWPIFWFVTDPFTDPFSIRHRAASIPRKGSIQSVYWVSNVNFYTSNWNQRMKYRIGHMLRFRCLQMSVPVTGSAWVSLSSNSTNIRFTRYDFSFESESDEKRTMRVHCTSRSELMNVPDCVESFYASLSIALLRPKKVRTENRIDDCWSA